MKIRIEATNWQSAINQLRELGVTVYTSCKPVKNGYFLKGVIYNG